MTANNASQAQLAAIQCAIDLLQNQANLLTGSVNPDAATWGNVTQFAHVADAAKCVIERLS